MPNIRESLYQCLENKLVATSTSPKLELFTVDPSCHAYAITVYVVYNNTSFLEINLNSGTVKSGNSDVGYYRIRQAALQSGENHSLYLVPSVQNGNTYYLALTHVTQGSDIFIRKELKFGVYSKLLSSLTSATLADGNKLTDIKFDQYNPDRAYSNGYFVETNDHTYVKQLLAKDNSGILGCADTPFDTAYVSTITTKDILNADANDKLNIGTNADRIDTVYSADVKTTNIDALKVDLGTLTDGNRPITIGADIVLDEDEQQTFKTPTKSGFHSNGYFDVKFIDSNHIYTQYQKYDNTYKQQIVVPGGLQIAGDGIFENITVSNVMRYTSHDLIDSIGENAPHSLHISQSGIIWAENLSLNANNDITDDNTGKNANSGGALDFVTSISQNSYGKVTYHHSVVSVRDTYTPEGDHRLKPVNSLALKDAIETLDVAEVTNTKGKTLKSIKEVDGKISTEYQDIEVVDGQVKVTEPTKPNSQSWPYADFDTADDQATILEALAKRARKVHAHGYINNDGCMEPTKVTEAKVKTPGSGHNILIADVSSGGKGKIKLLEAPFDSAGSDWSFLNVKGGWTASGLPTLKNTVSEHINGKSTTAANGDVTITHIKVHGNITDDGTIADDTAIANTFKFILANADGALVKSSLAFDGSSTDKYLSPKGTWESVPTRTSLDAAKTEHYHDGRYVRFDSAINLIAKADGMSDSAYATALNTAKATARSNIDAGTVNSVGISSNSETIAITGGPVTESGTINVDLPVKIDVGSSSYVPTTDNAGGTVSYDTQTSGFGIETPKLSVDAYGRVVGYTNFYQTIPGHTATYDYDSSTGTLTITVQ